MAACAGYQARMMTRFLLTCLAALAFGAGLVSADAQLRRAPVSSEEVRLSFAPVVRDTAPAVVNVYAERMVRSRATIFDDPLFREFFGGDAFGMPRERVSQSLGSGVLVSEDGVIVTNNHVVEGAQELRVVLTDRREFDAELLLADPRTDLAVLKIDAGREALPVLPFDRRGDVDVGDLVLAIGNPFGVGQTVTSGIVSALGRSEVGVSDYSFFIQTDAAINPGNSGGALVDLDGELIGINTAIFSRSGGSNGIGFAIPVDLVRRVVESAVTDGRIVRPWFGARGQAVTADIARSLGLSRPAGVLVSDVYPGSPAARAGVEVGDVVLSVDDQPVNDDQSIRFRLATRKVGETAALEVWRDGRTRNARLNAAAPPETPARDTRELSGANPLAGAQVANMSPAFNEEFGLDTFATGVVILDVERGGAADYYGFRPGDIVEAINARPVSTSRDLESVIQQEEGRRQWAILLVRDGRRIQRTMRF